MFSSSLFQILKFKNKICWVIKSNQQMAYLRGTSSAQTTLIAHLRSVSVRIKLSFNYGWVRPQFFTLRWICAKTPQQHLKKNRSGCCMLQGEPKAGWWPAWAHRVLEPAGFAHEAQQGKYHPPQKPRPSSVPASWRSPCSQAQAEESQGKAWTPLLSRWTGKQESWWAG